MEIRVNIVESPKDCKCGRKHFIANEHPAGDYLLVELTSKDAAVAVRSIWALERAVAALREAWNLDREE